MREHGQATKLGELAGHTIQHRGVAVQSLSEVRVLCKYIM